MTKLEKAEAIFMSIVMGVFALLAVLVLSRCGPTSIAQFLKDGVICKAAIKMPDGRELVGEVQRRGEKLVWLSDLPGTRHRRGEVVNVEEVRIYDCKDAVPKGAL